MADTTPRDATTTSSTAPSGLQDAAAPDDMLQDPTRAAEEGAGLQGLGGAGVGGAKASGSAGDPSDPTPDRAATSGASGGTDPAEAATRAASGGGSSTPPAGAEGPPPSGEPEVAQAKAQADDARSPRGETPEAQPGEASKEGGGGQGAPKTADEAAAAATPEASRATDMTLPSFPGAISDPSELGTFGSDLVPAGMKSMGLFGLQIPDPFFTKERWTDPYLPAPVEDGADTASKIAGGGSKGATGLGLLGKAGGAAYALKTGAKASMGAKQLFNVAKGGSTMAGQILGPIALAGSVLSLGVGIYDAITVGPVIWDTLFDSNASLMKKGAFGLFGLSTGLGILGSLAGIVSGAAATAALIVTCTGYGAAAMPFIGKVSLWAGVLAGVLGVASFAAGSTAAILLRLSELDEAASTEGVMRDAQEQSGRGGARLVARLPLGRDLEENP